MNIREYQGAYGNVGIDQSEIITRVCACGSELFRTVVSFDENYEISAYGLDGTCLECNAPVKLPCPVDLPETF